MKIKCTTAGSTNSEGSENRGSAKVEVTTNKSFAGDVVKWINAGKIFQPALRVVTSIAGEGFGSVFNRGRSCAAAGKRVAGAAENKSTSAQNDMQSQKTAGSTSRKPNALSESQKRQRFQADSCSSGSGNENDRINKKKKTAQEQQKVNAPGTSAASHDAVLDKNNKGQNTGSAAPSSSRSTFDLNAHAAEIVKNHLERPDQSLCISRSSKLPGQVARRDLRAPHAKGLDWVRSGEEWRHRRWRQDIAGLTVAATNLGGYHFDVGNYNSVVRLNLERMKNGTSLMENTTNDRSGQKSFSSRATSARPKLLHSDLLVTDLIWKLHSLAGNQVGVVNPGDRFTPGGGFATGGRHALEEALCTQSTLYPALVHAHKQFRQNNRPFGHYEVIVTPRVEFFRFGNEYLFSAHTRSVTVLTMPMYNKNHRVHGQPVDAPKGEKEYIGGVERKFRSLFHAAEEAGVGRLLLCDIGCGVYQNDPRVVGRCLGRVMAELPFGSVKEVVVSGDRRFFQAANSALLRLSKQ